MTAREVVTLNETIPQLEVPQAGDTYTMPRDVSVTGNIAVSGTVDGRDVATDGTKLDGVESNATADQTGAEIKVAYEAEADTNAFTDAEQTKLTGIEAGAQVNVAIEGAALLSTGEVGGSKFLREDGDGTSSWQAIPAIEGADVLSTGPITDGYVLTADGAGGSAWEVASGGTASPLTTKGDLWGYTTVDARLPVGTDDQVLTADSTAAEGVAWKDAAAGGGWDVDDDTDFNYGHGLNALDSVVVSGGLRNVAIGYNAGTGITTSDDNVCIGDQAGQGIITEARNTIIGSAAFGTGRGVNNTIVGQGAALNATSSCNTNVGVGYRALEDIAGSDFNVAVGGQALLNMNAPSGGNTGVGYNVADSLTSGINNTFLGRDAGTNLTTGDCSIAIGYLTTVPSATDDDQLVIGNGEVSPISGYMGARSDLDYSGKTLTITGPSAYASATTNQNGGDLELRPGQPASGGGTKGSLIIDDLTWPAADGTADQVLSTDGAGTLSWATAGGGGGWDVDDDTDGNYGHGSTALDSLTDGLGNVGIGKNASTAVTTGDYNVSIGEDAGSTVDGGFGNIAIGRDTCKGVTTGDRNVYIGYLAGDTISGTNDNDVIGIGTSAAQKGGEASVCIGKEAGTGGASTQVALGQRALRFATGVGSVGVGHLAGDSITTGAYNIVLGYWADPDSPTDDHQISIGHGTAVPVINGYMGVTTDVDTSAKKLTVTGPSALPAAATNQNGGDLELRPGQPASGGGSAGNIIMTDLPTSDPSVAGALWSNSGVLTVSSG